MSAVSGQKNHSKEYADAADLKNLLVISAKTET
jgi:hypothetical protein